MTRFRNVSSLIIVLLSIVAIHGLLSMVSRDSLSSMAHKSQDRANVLGISNQEPSEDMVVIFYHRYYLPQ